MGDIGLSVYDEIIIINLE